MLESPFSRVTGLKALRPTTLLKRESNTGIFLLNKKHLRTNSPVCSFEYPFFGNQASTYQNV